MSETRTVPVDVHKIKILGALRVGVFDPVLKEFHRMYGFFIEYCGVNYGSITVTQDELMAFINACICPDSAFRLHTNMFVTLLN